MSSVGVQRLSIINYNCLRMNNSNHQVAATNYDYTQGCPCQSLYQQCTHEQIGLIKYFKSDHGQVKYI